MFYIFLHDSSNPLITKKNCKINLLKIYKFVDKNVPNDWGRCII